MTADVRKYLERSLRRHEGAIRKPYRDTAGCWTIGVGRNLTDKGLRDEEIAYLLVNDMREAEQDVTRTWPWVAQLDGPRQAVLYELCFNLGLTRLRKFEPTMLVISARRFAEAADRLLRTKWADDVGKEPGQRAYRLAEQLRSGAWQDAT